jgi:hypothetical protein
MYAQLLIYSISRSRKQVNVQCMPTARGASASAGPAARPQNDKSPGLG